jgi:hypothetical protein
VTLPPNIEIGKYYYKKHVEDITQELNDALSLGQAAAEEWSKGLDDKGKERMKIADNWEKWEARALQERSRAASAAPSITGRSRKESSTSPMRQMLSPVIHTPVPLGKYSFAVPLTVMNVGFSSFYHHRATMPSLTTAAPYSQYTQPRPPTVPPQVFTPQPGQTGSTQPSHQRNLHDANEAKATRKTDIERRCQQMSPSIPPNILRHMDSFKAAIQISQPMTDYAWSVLLPRLVAQLPAAQQAEANHVSHAPSLSSKPVERRFQDVNSKEAKEAMDREWEDLQRPIRDKLSALADDFISQDWDQGKALTFESSPKFAADLLAHVRRKFYDTAATENGAPQAQQHPDTDSTASRPKLVLENMKWVYDNKIRPLTEQFRKDLFFCNGPDCESSNRPYGFEGVVQHYGAKHTGAFSSGNIVVAWREAEWPEETPFNPDPVSVQSFHHGHAPSSNGYPGHFGGYTRAGTATPHMLPHVPQASPGPYPYGGGYNGPFHPPQAPSGPIPGYEYPQPYGVQVDNFAFSGMAPPGYVSQMGGNSYMPSPAMVNSGVAPPPAMPPPGHVAPEPSQDSAEDASHSTILFDKQVSTIIGMSQDVWKDTAGIKDMPNSLRIYVLLHHVIIRFHVDFNHEPNLDHFIDAFSNHEMPKSLKLAPGLSCKACQTEPSHQSTGSHYAKSAERKTYTALNLLSHFRTQHLTPHPYAMAYGQQAPQLDWKEDMVELPNERFISGLIYAPGMTDEKLLMIAKVFPKTFNMPLPKILNENNGMVSPPLSGSKEVPNSEPSGGAPDEAGPSSLASAHRHSPGPGKLVEDEYGLYPPSSLQTTELSSSAKKQQSHRDGSSGDRRQRVYPGPHYYVGGTQRSLDHIGDADGYVNQMPMDDLDDGYARQREYVEYPTSPRMNYSGPAYEYSGRRTGFREHERPYGPPPEEIIYAHPREGSHGREYGAYPRQPRYYSHEDHRPEPQYRREALPRDAGSPIGQSAADRFLDDLMPGQVPATEIAQPRSTQQPELKQPLHGQEASEGVRFTSPLPPNVSITQDQETAPRQLAAIHPRAPSTVSNSSRFDEYPSNGHYVPMSDSGGPQRRVGPQRRRDRPHDQRMASRYLRVAARDEPYGRGVGPNMSRSQSRRYEEQRRRIDQQETPQPHAEPEYEPAYSRDHSIDQAPLDEHFYPRQTARGYVSVQDRLEPYSPPRYRYEEPRAPVYLDEYGYEVVRVPRDPRLSRAPYMPYPQSSRYDQERYGYVPVPYERPAPHRYNSRGEHYYEDRERERERPLPRRPAPAPEVEPEVYEPAGPEIKVESAPVPMPPEGP